VSDRRPRATEAIDPTETTETAEIADTTEIADAEAAATTGAADARYLPGGNVTLAHAEEVLRRVRDFAAETGIIVAAVVVDAGGHTVAAMRMDGARFVSIDIAREKAWTASAFPRPTATWQELSAPGARFWGLTGTLGGRISVLPGGAPLAAGDRHIGAVGISGGTEEQDHDCALYAAESRQAS
jgi:uncharacterized protein GlcG (DUF336 family)